MVVRNLCRRRARCREKTEHAFPWLGMRCSNIQSSREMTAFGVLAISWPQDYLFVTGRNPIGKTLIKIRNVVIDVVTHHKNCIQDPIFLATIGEPAAEENDRTDVELKHAYQGIARPLFAVSVEKTAENEPGPYYANCCVGPWRPNTAQRGWSVRGLSCSTAG